MHMWVVSQPCLYVRPCLYVCVSCLYVCESCLYVCVSCLYVCESCLYVCESCLYVCVSCLYVCESCLHVCESCLYVCESCLYFHDRKRASHVSISTTERERDKFQGVYAIFLACKSRRDIEFPHTRWTCWTESCLYFHDFRDRDMKESETLCKKNKGSNEHFEANLNLYQVLLICTQDLCLYGAPWHRTNSNLV